MLVLLSWSTLHPCSCSIASSAVHLPQRALEADIMLRHKACTVHPSLLSVPSKTLLRLHAGMRFAGADTTVKLRQDTTYIISITTQPAVAVT